MREFLPLDCSHQDDRLIKFAIERFVCHHDVEHLDARVEHQYDRTGFYRPKRLNAKSSLFRLTTIDALQKMFVYSLKFASTNQIDPQQAVKIVELFNEVHDLNFRTGPVQERNSFSFEFEQTEDFVDGYRGTPIGVFVPMFNGSPLESTLVERLQEAGYTEATTIPLDLECSVCYNENDVKAIIVTSCNHLFCHNCITRWLRTNETCPMCRSHIVKREAQYVLMPESESA